MFSEPQFIVFVNNCLLPKLPLTYDVLESNECFTKYLEGLDRKIKHVFCILNYYTSDITLSSNALANAFILYNELLSPGPWNNENCFKQAYKLNERFEKSTNISLKNLLTTDYENVEKHEIFDTCMMKLHFKLTSDDFKKYPAQVKVYCRLIENTKDYQINPDPLNIIPMSLILVDDFVMEYKIDGLKCLFIILQLMKPTDFKNGNYYEVIFGTLKKSLPEKDREVTELVLQCFLKLLIILPSHVKMDKSDNVLACILEEHYMESNLYRKAIFLRYAKELLKIVGVDCVKRKKKIINIFSDNIDMCANNDVAKVLSECTLQCLEEWIIHSWGAWRFKTDKKLLITLMKFVVTCNDEICQKKVLNLMRILTELSTEKEQIQIKNDFTNMLDLVITQAETTEQNKDTLDNLLKFGLVLGKQK